ncbi:GPW/gp25 family protein [bacterium]|nr:GPW/gp25 family protein [bacterium]MDB4319892.1 GPW/gp25 family protein [bacterium]MDB9992631.1 GPW/gp25 family protein [bacterium]
MPTIIPNKSPIDTEARRAVGFSLPLNGNAVFKPTYQTRDQIKSNLINFMLTNNGERVFNSNFGLDLRSYVFENTTDLTIEEIEFKIQEGIADYFPQVSIENLSVSPNPDANQISITVIYSIPQLGVEDEITISLV